VESFFFSTNDRFDSQQPFNPVCSLHLEKIGLSPSSHLRAGPFNLSVTTGPLTPAWVHSSATPELDVGLSPGAAFTHATHSISNGFNPPMRSQP